MELTNEEMALLDGKEGYGRQKAMEILETLGDIFEADRLIPVTSAQVSGVSYKNLGEAGLDFIREIGKDTKVSIPTTLNPAGIDLENWKAMGVDSNFAERQEEVIKAYSSLGIIPSCSCTPYHDINIPALSDHIAWAESSAVCYANSVLGARTNREGGPSALAAAIVGKTPRYGLHLDENRKAKVIIEVSDGVTDMAALGYTVGALVKDRVPYLRGVAPNPSDLKAMCAAMAASGAVALYHVEDVTPEAGQALEGQDPETMTVTAGEVGETAASLTITDEDVQMIALGCPHLSVTELEALASLLKDKEPRKNGPRLWVCTSRTSKKAAMEAVKVIERFGLVLADTCMVVSPIEGLFQVTATSSAKAAHYLAMDKYGGQRVRYGTLEEVLALL
jgi:predicted aconitase